MTIIDTREEKTQGQPTSEKEQFKALKGEINEVTGLSV